MTLDDFLKLIMEQAYILVPALYIIGAFMKQTPAIKDYYIPWVLLAIGIMGAVGLLGFNSYAVVQGVLVTGVAVLTNQLYKQTMNGKKDADNKKNGGGANGK